MAHGTSLAHFACQCFLGIPIGFRERHDDLHLHKLLVLLHQEAERVLYPQRLFHAVPVLLARLVLMLGLVTIDAPFA